MMEYPLNEYLGQPVNLKLPTVDYMASRVREIGAGCFMYKLDLSRGYRQFCLDPLDWPLMSILHNGEFYMDVCPPFGLRTAALMMERTTLAVSYIHQLYGYITKPYIDDFGGAESQFKTANEALCTLQGILRTVGLEEAPNKTVQPTTEMIWLGININSEDMTLSIPEQKLLEIKKLVAFWNNKTVATRNEVQSLMGVLNFISSVASPVRVYTNRVLNFLRSLPKLGTHVITDEVRQDLEFFLKLMPEFNGISLIDKQLVSADEQLEIDSCLTGCGGLCSNFYYSCVYPDGVIVEGHPIAHLEMINAVVALRLWAPLWSEKKLQIFCDNSNVCIALQTGRSRDHFMQACVRTVFLMSVTYDVEILVCHRPGVSLVAADSLSSVHTSERLKTILEELGCLEGKIRIHVPVEYFKIDMS